LIRTVIFKMCSPEIPDSDSLVESESSISGNSEADEVLLSAERPPKRRRLSDDSADGIAARGSLQTLTRIKKKIPQGQVAAPQPQVPEAEPVTAKDALAIGINASDSTFGALGLDPWLVGSLSTMAIKRPTQIQRTCIPEILKGRDCIGGSRTGSGKTVAFAAPMLQKWSEDPFGIFGVILTPTRYLISRCCFVVGGFAHLF
jgi:ATP-dependent RNA helicase DDX49/DBP8